ncbi:DegT/DnrJ/EryC1/StrS family aminotransferase [Bradyrhizobium diazoefficiens]
MEEFEKRVRDYVGTRYAVAVASGTAGLHLCMRLAGVKEGSEVVTSPFSFVASANCILYEHGTPVFVDIDEDSFNIDADAIDAAVNDRTVAILPIHVFGRPARMDQICRTADRRGLAVIEDACEAIGAEFDGRKVGAFGRASVFAFYPNKQMTTGEGRHRNHRRSAMGSRAASLAQSRTRRRRMAATSSVGVQLPPQ